MNKLSKLNYCVFIFKRVFISTSEVYHIAVVTGFGIFFTKHTGLP